MVELTCARRTLDSGRVLGVVLRRKLHMHSWNERGILQTPDDESSATAMTLELGSGAT